MTTYNIVNSSHLVGGQPEDVSDVLANYQAIATVLNGNLDNNNLNAAAAVAASKLAGYPTDGTKALFGDGLWKVPTGSGVGAQLADTLLAIDTASFDFQNLSQSYTQLHVVTYGRTDTAAGTDELRVRFNNDSAANYDRVTLKSTDSTVTGTGSAGVAYAAIGDVLTANTATALKFGACHIIIPNYINATNHKVFTAHGGHRGLGSALAVMVVTGQWNATAAISRITLLPGAGTVFKAGSRATVFAF